MHATSLGGGVFQANVSSNFPFSISGSIVAGNIGGGGRRVAKDPAEHARRQLQPDRHGDNAHLRRQQRRHERPPLGPLADNGGPTPDPRDAGQQPGDQCGRPGRCTTGSDQRGDRLARVFGGRIDIGAYERQTLVAAMFGVSIAADELNTALRWVSLREAIDSANGSVGANTVTFAGALTSGGPAYIYLQRGELAIRDPVTVNGPGADLLTIYQATIHNRVLNIDDGSGTPDAVEISRSDDFGRPVQWQRRWRRHPQRRASHHQRQRDQRKLYLWIGRRHLSDRRQSDHRRQHYQR